MQKNYFLVAVVLSLVLLGGIFLRGQDRYEQVQNAVSPFETKLYRDAALNGGTAKGTLALDRSGHLLVLFENSLGEWAGSRKQIIDGTVFLSGSFLGDADSLSNAQKPAPDFPYTKLRAGEVLSGNTVIRFGRGGTLIERDDEQKSTKIYADDQEVDVFFLGKQEPFVIPAGMRVTIFDDQINKNTAQLYYSKLRKKTEFRLESFLELDDQRPNILEARERIKNAQQLRKAFLKKLERYTEAKAKAWRRDSQGLFQGPKRLIQSFQQTFDFITLPKRKQLLAFNIKAKDFLKALEAVENKDKKVITESLNRFQETLKDPSWKLFLEKNELIADEWSDFSMAQKAIVQYGDTKVYADLYDFWFIHAQDPNMAQFREGFAKLQRFIAQKTYAKALEEADHLIILSGTIDSHTWSLAETTRYRRLIAEILRNISYFEDKPSLHELLRLLTQKELSHQQDEENKAELTLEIAQDVLDFLHEQSQREDEMNDAILGKLQQTYKSLDLEGVIGGVSQNKIFSKPQLNMIIIINKIGDKALTKDRIQALLEKDQAVIIAQEQYAKELAKKEADLETQKYEFKQINSTNDLRSYFVILGARTSQLIFSPGQDPNYINFSDLYFNNRKIDGGFHIEGQFFDNISLGAERHERLSLDEFNKALFQSKMFVSHDLDGGDKVIPQTTARAQLERLLVQQKIKNLGLTVDFESIAILDKESTTFSIEGVRSGNQYRADFIYRKNNQSVEKIYLQFLGNTKNFDDPIPFYKLKEVLDEASTLNMRG
ncbi:MAG TPA: hypothetical protein VIT68_02185 [Candidatus Gracilibacteria bacterium]